MHINKIKIPDRVRITFRLPSNSSYTKKLTKMYIKEKETFFFFILKCWVMTSEFLCF